MNRGRLVTELTPEDLEAKRVQAPTGNPGAATRIWGLPGRWSVWSLGIARSTRWLLAVDPDAKRIAKAAKDNGSDVWPVITDTSAGAVLVELKYLRNVVL